MDSTHQAPTDIAMDSFPDDEFDSLMEAIAGGATSGSAIPETPDEDQTNADPTTRNTTQHTSHQLWEKVHIAGLLHTATLTQPTTSMHRILQTGLRLIGSYTATPVPDYQQLVTEKIDKEHTNVFKSVKYHLTSLLIFIVTVNYLPQLDRLSRLHKTPQFVSKIGKPQGLPAEFANELKRSTVLFLQEAQSKIINANCIQMQNGIKHHVDTLVDLLVSVTNDVGTKLIDRVVTVTYNRLLNALITKTRHLVNLEPNLKFKLLKVCQYVEPHRRKGPADDDNDNDGAVDESKGKDGDHVDDDSEELPAKKLKRHQKRPRNPDTKEGNGSRQSTSKASHAKKSLGHHNQNGKMGVQSTSNGNKSKNKKHHGKKASKNTDSKPKQ